jgi:hypothetical protein
LNRVANDFEGFRLNDRSDITDAWVEWITGIRLWSTFISLTFKDFIGPEAAIGAWGRLLRVLNKQVVGDHYTRVVKHSYFSYCLGIERQTRGVLHFHVIVDRSVDYGLIHRYWESAAGWAWIKKIDDRAGAVEYLTKYVVKGGEIRPYLADPPPYELKPGKNFTWWIV